MRTLFFTIFFLSSSFVFAHGDIKLIECYSVSGKEVLRATKPLKSKNYHFKVYKESVLKTEFKDVKIVMTDTVTDGQLIENLDFTLGKTPVKIEILETPLRKIRSGSVALNLKHFKGRGTCSAVY